MRSNEPHFLLVGNGSYQNRGCEAIVRGTVEILRHEFGESFKAPAGIYAEHAIVQEQNDQESDPAVESFPLHGVGPRWSLSWWAAQADKRLGTSFLPAAWDLRKASRRVTAALQVGGDNYSLDYGKPLSFMEMDRYLMRRGIPVVLWGASVGPFDQEPDFAQQMFAHLRRLDAICVRESESLAYLQRNGVASNVHLVADPAFLMRPKEPDQGKCNMHIPPGTIGINLSPIVGRFRRGDAASSDLGAWLKTCAGLVAALDCLGHPLLLVPHVQSSAMANDDVSFLEALRDKLADRMAVPVMGVPPGLSAAELKWVISRCEVFVGARTHATIAALSTHVPTLSIGYSVKARGINQDLFGHLKYCVAVGDLNKDLLLKMANLLLDERETIRAQLAEAVPIMQARAMEAGPLLRRVVVSH